jgi:hypothetical protein
MGGPGSLLHALALGALVAAGRVRRVERQMSRRFEDAGADVADRAITVERAAMLDAFVFRRLRRAGVLEDAGHDRYYWDAAAYDMFRGRRRRRASIALAALLLGLLMLFYRGDISL